MAGQRGSWYRGRGPRGGGNGGRGQQGRGQARVFHLTQQDAQASGTVVSGIIPVCSVSARVLFDTVLLIHLLLHILPYSLCVHLSA